MTSDELRQQVLLSCCTLAEQEVLLALIERTEAPDKPPAEPEPTRTRGQDVAEKLAREVIADAVDGEIACAKADQREADAKTAEFSAIITLTPEYRRAYEQGRTDAAKAIRYPARAIGDSRE